EIDPESRSGEGRVEGAVGRGKRHGAAEDLTEEDRRNPSHGRASYRNRGEGTSEGPGIAAVPLPGPGAGSGERMRWSRIALFHTAGRDRMRILQLVLCAAALAIDSSASVAAPAPLPVEEVAARPDAQELTRRTYDVAFKGEALLAATTAGLVV